VPANRHGFTLIELLVSIAIMAVLTALIVPALTAAREAARQGLCQDRLQQLGMALRAYHDAQTSFPSGVVSQAVRVQANADGDSPGWIIPLLPELDQALLFSRYDASRSLTSPENQPFRKWNLPSVRCPSDNARRQGGQMALWPPSSYAGCHHDQAGAIALGNTGILSLNTRYSDQDISDGTCCTFLVGEIRSSVEDQGWASGTRATLRNTGTPINQTRGDISGRDAAEQFAGSPLDVQNLQPPQLQHPETENAPAPDTTPEPVATGPDVTVPGVSNDPGGFGSLHRGGAYFLFADGRSRFFSESIDQRIYRQLANRADEVSGKTENF